MKKTKSFQKKPEKLSGNEQEGLLIALFGAVAEVEDSANRIIRCHIRKNLEPVITGDRVLWQQEDENTGIIVDFKTRKSLLARPENNGKMKPLAANIDAIIVVASPQGLSENLIDCYLIAAENLKITPVLLLNKIDLLADNSAREMKDRLSFYENIGYKIIYSSTLTKHGLEELDTFLQQKTCVLVGASGVGKSSIISAFAPHEPVKIGDVSEKGSGKHTTTMTRLYHLPQGGNLIDSPGVREFSIWHMTPQEISQGFIEFNHFKEACKFRNCLHLKEPGCAVKKAVDEGKIDKKRLESYQKLLS